MYFSQINLAIFIQSIFFLFRTFNNYFEAREKTFLKFSIVTRARWKPFPVATEIFEFFLQEKLEKTPRLSNYRD